MTQATTLNLLETRGIEFTAIMSELDSNFPIVNPSPNTSIEQIMYQAGQRSVVDWIKERLE